MTALQGMRLSVRLPPLVRSLPLPKTTRQSSSHCCHSCHNFPPSPRFVFRRCVFAPLPSRSSRCFLSGGPSHLKLRAFERNSGETLPKEGSEENEEVSEFQTGGQGEFFESEIQVEYTKYVKKSFPVATKEVQAPNYLTMSDSELFGKCRMDTYRASGPGGQHRNKTESAVRLTHVPTGLVSQAADDRSQHINRALALTRLRQVIAQEVRDPVELEGYKASPELLRILPHGVGGKRGNSQRIGPNHPDFVVGMKALLDLMSRVGGSVSEAATILGISTGALSKLILSSNALWQGVNKLRASRGLKPLR